MDLAIRPPFMTGVHKLGCMLAACMLLVVIGTTVAVHIEHKLTVPAALFVSLLSVGAIAVILFTYIR